MTLTQVTQHVLVKDEHPQISTVLACSLLCIPCHSESSLDSHKAAIHGAYGVFLYCRG